MGIDPGFAFLGISKLLYDPSIGYDLEGVHLIETKKRSKKLGLRAKTDDTRRLDLIVDQFDEIVRQWPADIYAFEETPSPRNSMAARKVALAWGACYAIARRRSGVIILQYEPMALKEVVTGNPKASKKEMIEVLASRFPVIADTTIVPSKQEHVADATAAALKAAQDPAVQVLIDAMKRVTS